MRNRLTDSVKRKREGEEPFLGPLPITSPYTMYCTFIRVGCFAYMHSQPMLELCVLSPFFAASTCTPFLSALFTHSTSASERVFGCHHQKCDRKRDQELPAFAFARSALPLLLSLQIKSEQLVRTDAASASTTALSDAPHSL